MSAMTPVRCIDCRQERLVDLSKSKPEVYIAKHPRCNRCSKQGLVNDGQFKGGVPSWNKGMPRWWDSPTEIKKGQHLSPATEFTPDRVRGVKSYMWKGDKVGYSGLHSWLAREYGRPSNCEFCDSQQNVQWASKDYSYKRDRIHWLALCFRCHRKYDRKNGWGVATAIFPELRRA